MRFNILEKLKKLFYNDSKKRLNIVEDKILDDIPKGDKIEALKSGVNEKLKEYGINDNKHFEEFFNKTFDIEKVANEINRNSMENMKNTLTSAFLYTDSTGVDGSNEITFKDIIFKYPNLVKDELIEGAKNNKIKNLKDLDRNIKEIISKASKKDEDHNNKLEKKVGKLNEKEI